MCFNQFIHDVNVTFLKDVSKFVKEFNIMPTVISVFMDPEIFVERLGLDQFEITYEDLKKDNDISLGGYSAIYEVKKDGTEYIFKLVDKENGHYFKQRAYLASEMIFLEYFMNKCGSLEENKVVNIFAANFSYDNFSFLLLERGKMDFEDYFFNKEDMGEVDSFPVDDLTPNDNLENPFDVSYQLINIVEFVHNEKIAHLDIKPCNFIVVEDKNGAIRIKVIFMVTVGFPIIFSRGAKFRARGLAARFGRKIAENIRDVARIFSGGVVG